MILGMSGCGKTTLVKKMLEPRPRVILLDPMADEVFDGEYGDVGSFKELSTFAARTPHFHLRWPGAPQDPRLLEYVSGLVLSLKSVTLAVDELHLFITKSDIGPQFKAVSLTGRHDGVSVVASSQRPQLIHNTYLSQVYQWRVGRLVLPADLAALRPVVLDVDRARDLPVGSFLEYP